MAIEDAITQVQGFKGTSLAETIATIESQLRQTRTVEVSAANQTFGVSYELLKAAAAVKQASAQIDVVFHAVGILCALPHILDQDEVYEAHQDQVQIVNLVHDVPGFDMFLENFKER